MAERLEVISVVSYASDGGLSWRFQPDEIACQFSRYGVEDGSALIREQFERALQVAASYFKESSISNGQDG